MNIDDVTEVKLPDGSRFEAIFNYQHELMKKYGPIERRNGCIIPDPPYDIDNHFVQARIRDMFWRATEEIAEALEEVPGTLRKWRDVWDDDSAVRHVLEELSDTLHFMVEASTYANFDAHVLDTQSIWGGVVSRSYPPLNKFTLRTACADYVFELGLAANCLKNKPWKQSQMVTDRDAFNARLEGAWANLLIIFALFGMSIDEVYVLYAKKNIVNQFRQRSNY